MPSTCNFLQWQNLALQLFQSPFHCCFYYFPPLLSDLWTWSTVKALATALHKRNVLAVQEEGRGATRELQEPKQQKTTRCGHLWTLNVRQDGEIKHHCKANSEKEIFGGFFPPCRVHHLLKAISTEIKKTSLTGFSQAFVRLCILSLLPADNHDIFARSPWPVESSHLSLQGTSGLPSPVQNEKFWLATPESLLSLWTTIRNNILWLAATLSQL